MSICETPSAYLYSTLAHGNHLKQSDSLHMFLLDSSGPCPADAAAASFSSFALVILQDAASSFSSLLQDEITKPKVIATLSLGSAGTFINLFCKVASFMRKDLMLLLTPVHFQL